MNEMVYLYDGSFEGLLCCIFDSYANKEILTAIFSDEDFAPTLFPTRTVTTRRMVRSATYLLFVLFGTAGIYFLLGYTFLGSVQIMVYAAGSA